MNCNIHTFYKFYAICIIPMDKIKNTRHKLKQLIPNAWELILMNEGSFTRVLNYLTNNIITIDILQKKYNSYETPKRIIRCVWLETSTYTKLTFAKSLWIFLDKHKYKEDKIININNPIGLSLIKYKIDTYKQIHEIYYGYCKNLEKDFQESKPIWGRKYTLYYTNQLSVTIQEFFSPQITHFFD